MRDGVFVGCVPACVFYAHIKRWRAAGVLSVRKVLSGSGRAGRLRLMGKYIGHRLVARPQMDNTFWTDSTSNFYSQLLI